MKKVILNLAVQPPGFDKVQHPGAIIELEDDLATRYVEAGYATFEGERVDLAKLKLNRMVDSTDSDNGTKSI